ncbi:DUF4129 domain-containing protein [Brevibacillus invocatus]|uniref:DUF4129 domain-containing protein n=1 Tax=Brevibacillus invocatus TaxID=173959 RepID=UPI002040F6F8|nr:DUF4129 domain-containing protein [Brevibacillus invocatus]MCM3079288.1 DUF4129 domain-containing protein [Brevibacillus invocatus]MCM3429386.1 DUF4129 domain-containing protein [Brevibacillus invocatus]
MSFFALGRLGIHFWMEALMTAGLLMLFGFLSISVTHMLVFGLAASALFLMGSWLHQSGSRILLLHLLMYPLFAGIGMLGYLFFDSWLIALLLTGLLYWRVQSISQSSFQYDNLQNRFFLTVWICLTHLIIAVLFLRSGDGATIDPVPFYGMFILILASYLVLNWLVYMTDLRNTQARPSVGMTLSLGTQLLATRSLVVAGYVLCASLLLWLIGSLWAWLKEPVGELLYLLFSPILELFSEWSQSLAGLLANNKRITDMLHDQGGAAEQAQENMDGTGVPLFASLEPYLIGGTILLVAVLLALYIWRQRNLTKAEADHQESQPIASSVLTDLAPPEEPEQPMLDLDRFFHRRPGPTEDPVRYAYFEFLQHMSRQGIQIYRYETSQEFLQRLRIQLNNAEHLVLAERITRYYEQYRYQEHSLSPEDLAAMQQAVRQLIASSA